VRLIQLRLEADSRESVLDALDEEDIAYAVADEGDGGDGALVYFPLPDGAVEPELDNLRDAGLDEDAFTIISTVESATTPTFDQLQSEYTQGPEDEVGLSPATLRQNEREVTPDRAIFLALAALSAIVAAAGLLLDSAIVIVGAMVISPFTGATLSASVGMVVGDYPSVLDSLKSQFVGLFVGVASAAAAAAVFRWGYLVPPPLAVDGIRQVNAFSLPAALAFVIAIFAGAAGALALATDLPVAVAGVAVSAAIVPAAATVGIGVVWSKPLLALGALVLLFMNLLLINLAAFGSLRAFGYRPPESDRIRDHLHFDLRTVAYAVAGVAVLAVVLTSAASTYQYFLLVETVNHNVEDVLGQERYADVEVVEVRTDFGGQVLLSDARPDVVTVTIARSGDEEYPDLSRTIQRQIAADTPRRVAVRVRFIDYQQSGPTAAQSRSNRPTRRPIPA
jgi:uncharacterized hydrophobic protein (TIGR00271 family)